MVVVVVVVVVVCSSSKEPFCSYTEAVIRGGYISAVDDNESNLYWLTSSSFIQVLDALIILISYIHQIFFNLFLRNVE